MSDRRCDQCDVLYPENELLIAESDDVALCQQCSGLLDGEDLGCRYDEG